MPCVLLLTSAANVELESSEFVEEDALPGRVLESSAAATAATAGDDVVAVALVERSEVDVVVEGGAVAEEWDEAEAKMGDMDLAVSED